MAKKRIGDIIGGWAFLVGLILALIMGLFGDLTNTTSITALVIIGIIVGLFNIADKEVTPFLFSGLVLVLVAGTGANLLSVVPKASEILFSLMIIFVPATIIVAIKNVLSLARN